MSSYIVYYSDPVKAATPVVVEDNTKNTVDTSITLLGKNSSGYSQAISNNFLHMLENFASPLAPNNPIEGQIWYDNATHRLKINDSTAGGANWKPVSGVYQQTAEPGDAIPGDIWIDTERAQLFLTIDGINWTLVGPNYSSVLKTGSYPEVINDKFGVPHTIIKQYINDNVVEVISADTFVPQQIINGFDNIQAGINLTSIESAKLNATAYATERVLVTSPYTEYVLGNNFVRNDIDNSINAVLDIRDGIKIGTDPTFILQKTGSYENLFLNSYNGGTFSFKINDSNSIAKEILRLDGYTKKIGINVNGLTPLADLDVRGDILVSGSFTATSTNSNLTSHSPAQFLSTVRVSGTSTFTSSATFKDTVFVGQVTPLTSNTYDIGTVSNPFYRVFANTFNGNVVGNVSGSAASLLNTSSWAMSGQLSSQNIVFKGIPNNYIFDAKLTANAINSQTVVTSAELTDSMLVATESAVGGIAQITKANLLADLYANLVPSGAVLPWAGIYNPSADNNNIPSGWLICDGSTVDKIYYPSLFTAIGYAYGKTGITTQFKLPDLRGRMVIGYDDMSNQLSGSPTSAANRVPEAGYPDPSIAAAGYATLVTGGANTATITAGSGPVGVGATSAQISSVMNPYFAFNYIIKI